MNINYKDNTIDSISTRAFDNQDGGITSFGRDRWSRVFVLKLEFGIRNKWKSRVN